MSDQPFEPDVKVIPNGDATSMYPRVTVRVSDTRQVNVGEAWIEWGTPESGGTDGADIELLPTGGCLLRFQESSRIFVCDRRGIRIYNSDSQDEDRLIVGLDHADYHAGLPPVIGPAGVRSATPYDGTCDDDEVLARSKQGAVSYDQCIREAADLASEHGENSEYDRGMYELLARLFGIEDYPTEARASIIEADVRDLKPVQP